MLSLPRVRRYNTVNRMWQLRNTDQRDLNQLLACCD